MASPPHQPHAHQMDPIDGDLAPPRRSPIPSAPIRYLLMATLAFVLTAAPAGAIIDGEFDGTNHPYVAVLFLLSPERFITGLCSGAAISPTLVVTAAHCFPEEEQELFVSFEADLTQRDPRPHIITGTRYRDPQFCRSCGPASTALPGFRSHDGAIVVLDEPIVLERYAHLPSVGDLETLAEQRPRLDVVGYGIQTRLKEFDFLTEPVTRNVAETALSPGDAALGDDFVKLSANPGQDKGRICAGDSGGPVLDGDTMLATTSLGLTGNCIGVFYAYRLDTTAALAFISEFLTAPSGQVAAESVDRGSPANPETATGGKHEEAKDSKREKATGGKQNKAKDGKHGKHGDNKKQGKRGKGHR